LLGEAMLGIAYVYYWTWFVWPFALVFGLAHGISELIQTRSIWNKGLLVAAVALLVILTGVTAPHFQ